jgi:glycosyltransferase involved in cell wall biosynthesis
VQFQLPRHVSSGLLSFCNLAPVGIRRHIVCIHDLHTLIMPESYPLLFRLAHRVILPILGRRARVITTVSNFVRGQLAEYGVARAEKVVVTYNGSDHAERWSAHRSTATIGPRPYVVCFGRRQKYKNGEIIWRISDRLDEMGIDIYVAGSVDEATLATFGSKVPRNVRLLGRISDDDLAKVLSEARCFLFPSRIEGFGLPAVEAMARGCPVVASTSPSLPEVCGDAALYAGPDDADAWVAAVRRLALDPALRERMIVAGYARARTFSWRRIAEIYLELMARADGVALAVPASST